MNQLMSFSDVGERPRHSTKKELRSLGSLSASKKRPPKLPTKRAYIRRLFTTRPTALLLVDNAAGLSQIYNESINSSYFDQCFDPVSKLGEGSFGEVYKVKSKEDGQYYAIKKTKECFRSMSDREEKVAEVRKHEKIPRHENCISLIHAWEQDDHVYLQMELGCTSLDVYAEHNSQINETRLWNILLDMLLALQNLHDNHLIHLDVKLANIMICENGSCKLGDFGLMMDLKGDLKNATEGDAKYLAPELMEGKFTKAADVFSLGISMLELASDMPLPTNGKLWHELRDGKYPEDVKDKIPKELFNFIQRMMVRDFKKRPSVRTLLKHPRLKSMLKQRREALEQGLQLEGRLTPIMRTSTPLPMVGTPPRVDSPGMINVIQATPPVGYNTPNNSFFGGYESSIEKSHFDTGMDFEIDTQSSFLNDSYLGFSPKFETPMPSYSRNSSNIYPLLSSAKKLDFLDAHD